MAEREEDVQSASSNLGSMAAVQSSLENLRDIGQHRPSALQEEYKWWN
jgi:hypothetical protein